MNVLAEFKKVTTFIFDIDGVLTDGTLLVLRDGLQARQMHVKDGFGEWLQQKLYERFGDDFTEAKIYRIRFTELLEWILQIPGFEGKREQSTEGHLEMIQSAWVYEWRDSQK